jgi:CHASE3 domain sensor protein
MDKILHDLKNIREETESRLNSLLEEAANLHAESNSLLISVTESAEPSLREHLEKTNTLLQSMLSAMRETIALNNARCAELARQLTVLPSKRFDLMLESIEKRLESLEADFLSSRRGKDDE